VRQRQARGLALIILAHENAVASGKEPQWIGDLYREAFAKSDNATRKEADALLPELGGVRAAVLPPAKKSPEAMVLPASGEGAKAASPESPAASDQAPLSKPGAPAPAPIGMSVGFGTPGSGVKP
jgi:hypothetical protein